MTACSAPWKNMERHRGRFLQLRLGGDVLDHLRQGAWHGAGWWNLLKHALTHRDGIEEEAEADQDEDG